MKSLKFVLLLIAALALSISGCKKDKGNPPPSSGGGGGGSTADCCICEFEGYDYPLCEDDYSAEMWDQVQEDDNCDCSANTAGFNCDGGCFGVTSGAEYNSQSACEDDCEGSGDTYDCIGGVCYNVGEGGTFATLSGCESNCSSNTYLVPPSGNNSITTCGGVIKDHAGDGNYDNNINGYTVINPSSGGVNVQLSFTYFALESGYDFVTVFDGAGTGGEILFNGSGTSLPPTITASNGPLTIKHTSDGSVNNAGFSADITCVPM